MKLELKIKNCRECLYSTNSSILHDDPFTSAPASVTWYCEKDKEPSNVIIDEYIIDPDCPINKT